MQDMNEAFDKLKIDTSNFQETEKLSEEAKNEKEKAYDFANYERKKWKMELEEIEWKNLCRKIYGGLFTLLLFIQNGATFYLIYKSYCQYRVQELQYILPVAIPATLIETAYIIKIMMEWIFSNIDYYNHKKGELK